MHSKKIIAHRGVPTLAPENTMAAFEKLTDFNINWLETDLGITKDRRVVVLHDDDLDRTTSLSGALTETTYPNLAKASAGAWFGSEYAQETVPTLEQLITFLNRTKINVNIELKAVTGDHANELADSLVAQFVAALDQIDPSIRVIVSSFSPVMLYKLKSRKADVETAVLFEQHTFYDDWLLIMQALDAKIIHPEDHGLTKAKVTMMKDHGYEINVWTVDKIDKANQLFNWGVDGIFTNIADAFPGMQKQSGKVGRNYGHFLTTWY
ncbi:glycerophosphodiester phosphodiesterase family protein [Agrilactobacillus fermenti]|uniref:glycerophosphodiester phosphodiesterase family protein n=1 Tax=Agrilactobacillus fermenti TaxID=2586909 RepID=UPI001E2CA6F3|nr:glycerophosphodiester phosphodiesterase family protein [Agrilactobacillus fermenti]MCD2255607.1 glycerophosphoryl diester phosphodiesterase [Agrilactobacillus fermenti]